MSLLVYEHGDRNDNKVALTFDDGPNPFWTIKILDALDKHNIKANFFLLGKRAEEYKDIVTEIFDRGHLIGNHTYSHSRDFGDFDKSEKIIFDIIGEHTKFIRPPYFLANLCVNYPPAINGEVKIINCDIISEDYKNKAEEIKRIVIGKTQKGSIIGFHDGSHKENELENRPSEMFKALPEILEKLKEKFEIVRLDQPNFLNN